jgi:hypothetical protein
VNRVELLYERVLWNPCAVAAMFFIILRKLVQSIEALSEPHDVIRYFTAV